MRIGFLSNQLDIRGTGNALYNYAHYNEELLGNQSKIFTYSTGAHSDSAISNFKKRFGEIYYIGDGYSDIEALYHIKSGYNDNFYSPVPYLVHSVFDNEPHGTVYATISPWMGERFSLPYVPHIVTLADYDITLRDILNIPNDATVFGRHGGFDSFDIPFVWDAINELLLSRDDVYFLFMNTQKPDIIIRDDRIFFLDASIDSFYKKAFINTCNAMIHARSRGETFGIAVGEFAISGIPVITYEDSPEKAHLQELGNFAYLYKDKDSLLKQFNLLIKFPGLTFGYGQYTPEKVMKKFNEVFLCGL